MLLEGHIEKEDNAVYMTARRVLDKKTQEKLTEEYEKIEMEEENIKFRNKYIEFANSL
jgi:hemerythrin-like domain-containing protein